MFQVALELAAEQHLPQQPVDVLPRCLRIELVQPVGDRQALRDDARAVLREVADGHFVSPAHGAGVDIGG